MHGSCMGVAEVAVVVAVRGGDNENASARKHIQRREEGQERALWNTG